jgi:TRAP transporter TAXI family solute receptor
MRHALPAAALALAAAFPAAADGITFFTIGAGPVGGGYYTAARAICDLVHAQHPGEMRCSPDPTPGSVYNVQALVEGELDFALVQSDTHKFAVTGTGPFAGAGPNPDLRSVLALYPEPLTVVARREAGLDRVQDLAGKRVNIGPRNSGTRATVTRLLEAVGADESFFGDARSLATSTAMDQLCEGSLDAVMIVVGHPNAMVARALSDCDATLLPVSGPAIDAHVAESPDFTPAVIGRGTYPGLTRRIETFSVTATLMTRADVDPAIVTAVARIVADNLPELNRRAPVIPAARTPGLASDGLSAPLYDGVADILATE